MSRFDSGLFLAAANTVWQEFMQHKKIGAVLADRNQKGIVLRIIDRRASTLLLEVVGRIPASGRQLLYDHSYAAAARLLAHPEHELSCESRTPATEKDSGAVRLGNRILAGAGIQQEFAMLLLLKAAVEAGFLSRARARELTLRFSGKPRSKVPDDTWEIE